ncbi:MAG: LytR C-terminal domain-containing protein [Candidatus Levyibacteriota bacterium]
MARRNNLQTNNLRIAFIFCLLVGIIVGISVLFKVALIIKNSDFDGKSDFNVIFGQNKKISVISFSPASSSIHILDIEGESISLSTIGRRFKIPIDGFVKIQSNEKMEDEGFDSLFKSALLGRADTKLTAIDIARLWLFSKTVSKSLVTNKNFLNTSEISDEEIDEISSSLFNDEVVAREKISIAIINGTNVLGFGNRLARLISNIGGNVVSVSSKEFLENSEITYTKNASSTNTLKRLNQILGFRKSESEKAEIADITIRIGKDSIDLITF